MYKRHDGGTIRRQSRRKSERQTVNSSRLQWTAAVDTIMRVSFSTAVTSAASDANTKLFVFQFLASSTDKKQAHAVGTNTNQDDTPCFVSAVDIA